MPSFFFICLEIVCFNCSVVDPQVLHESDWLNIGVDDMQVFEQADVFIIYRLNYHVACDLFYHAVEVVLLFLLIEEAHCFYYSEGESSKECSYLFVGGRGGDAGGRVWSR